MRVTVSETSKQMGHEAARYCADVLRQVIAAKGHARIILSTGASQFDTLEALVQQDVDWSRVEMFHLDEYINMSADHPASFRKYLQERFISRIPLGIAHLVDGEGDFVPKLSSLGEELRKAPIDLGVIGIGENTHVAFNDPPADFDTREGYKVVGLDERCRQQQFREGWFPTFDSVPTEAITMTVHQIMQCEKIVSCVPYLVKAEAVRLTLTQDVSPMVPATILKTHPAWSLYLDRDSASQLEKSMLVE